MHCVTWMESTKELISAKNSRVKFIVSDNPVTLYNPRYHPGNEWCEYAYGNGIPIFHKGTTTIFPVNMNYCLVLSNTEYVRYPKIRSALEIRTNPRLYDSVLARTNDIDRGKMLTDEDVLKINYLLKLNADRYVAASEEDWLFPEKYVSPGWISLNEFVLPESSGGRGEVFVFGKGGVLQYTEDEFGRRPSTAEEWKEKQKRPEE